jgi:hypothetical protein
LKDFKAFDFAFGCIWHHLATLDDVWALTPPRGCSQAASSYLRFCYSAQAQKARRCLILLDDVWVFEEITILFVIYYLFQFSSFGGC